MTKTSSCRQRAGGLPSGPQTNRGWAPPRIQTAQANEPGVQTGSSQNCRWAWTPPNKLSTKCGQIQLVLERNQEVRRKHDQRGIPGQVQKLEGKPIVEHQSVRQIAPEPRDRKEGSQREDQHVVRGASHQCVRVHVHCYALHTTFVRCLNLMETQAGWKPTLRAWASTKGHHHPCGGVTSTDLSFRS